MLDVEGGKLEDAAGTCWKWRAGNWRCVLRRGANGERVAHLMEAHRGGGLQRQVLDVEGGKLKVAPACGHDAHGVGNALRDPARGGWVFSTDQDTSIHVLEDYSRRAALLTGAAVVHVPLVTCGGACQGQERTEVCFGKGRQVPCVRVVYDELRLIGGCCGCAPGKTRVLPGRRGYAISRFAPGHDANRRTRRAHTEPGTRVPP